MRHRIPQATYPKTRTDRTSPSRTACFPIWSCSRWGLPCRGMLPPARCALTAPFHPCRRLAALWRYVFCGTFRRLAPPRRYLAPCPVEPGLSSTTKRSQRLSGRLPARLYPRPEGIRTPGHHLSRECPLLTDDGIPRASLSLHGVASQRTLS